MTVPLPTHSYVISPIPVLSRVFTLRLEQAVTRRLFCIAHRGGTGPENSLEAINASLALGVDAIEIDLWYAGGELLVTHDSRLGRLISVLGTLQNLTRFLWCVMSLIYGVHLPTIVYVTRNAGG